MGLVDDIRQFVRENNIEPARKKGLKQVTIRAGDVHTNMGLASRVPAVCVALETKIDEMCGLKLLHTKSTPSGRGSNSYYTYRLL